MSTTCEINFENKLNVVYTGQVIRGKVQLKLADFTIIRGVCIHFVGEAHIESSNNYQSNSRNEIYLNRKLYLAGSDDDDGKPIRLSRGTYDYSFDCGIPTELPTSVEGEYGHIRYVAKVVLHLTDWPHQLKFEEPFTVIRPRDLNLYPSLANPVIVAHNQIFFSSNPLRIAARLPVGGYVPGQTINLKLSVNNQSDETVSNFNVQMIKEIVYYICASNDQTRIETIILNESETVGGDKQQDQIIFLNISVPSIPPDDFCNIMNIKYSIRIRGEMENCLHSSPVLDVPIAIGTYPLKDRSAQSMTKDLNDAMAPDEEVTIPSNCTIRELPSAPPMSLISDKDGLAVECPSAPPSFPQDDPPTYEEATMSDPKENQFRPKYPTYRRQTTYSIGC